MRIAHLADLHLGFRQFQRVGPTGVNLRESDVARAFLAAVDAVIAIAPEVVVVAGDLFHASRPSNHAIVFAQKQFIRLRQSLPETIIVVVAGNHDAPRAADTGNILALFEPLGIHVAATGARRIDVPDLDLSIVAVPDIPGVQPHISPDPARRRNVLVVHGEVEYAEPVRCAGWDYVALGHYHVHRIVAPGASYAGSLDYTSTNPWGEIAEERAAALVGKGFVVADLEARTVVHHALPAPRAFADLGVISGAGKSAEDLDVGIREAVESCVNGIDGKVVRLVLTDVERPVGRSLDQKALRGYRARALNFQLAMHTPAAPVIAGMRSTRRLPSLNELVRNAFTRKFGETPEAQQLTELAIGYLDKAEAQQQDAAASDAFSLEVPA